MIFGIYPGGMSGASTGMTTGPANDPQQISSALVRLQGAAPMFIIRAYVGYKGKGQPVTVVPENPGQYVIADRASRPSAVLPVGRNRPRWMDGIVFAKNEILAAGLSVEVGFNATPDFNPNRLFWKEIRSLATPVFYQSLDYVGLDCFPDVFRPLARENGKITVYEPLRQLISFFRSDIQDAGISAGIPLHITENGWPTNSSRSETDQSVAIEAIITAIHTMRSELGIRVYEMFDLRDADSKSEDIFYRFGIMNDDYTTKPAFETYCSLISRLS